MTAAASEAAPHQRTFRLLRIPKGGKKKKGMERRRKDRTESIEIGRKDRKQQRQGKKAREERRRVKKGEEHASGLNVCVLCYFFCKDLPNFTLKAVCEGMWTVL